MRRTIFKASERILEGDVYYRYGNFIKKLDTSTDNTFEKILYIVLMFFIEFILALASIIRLCILPIFVIDIIVSNLAIFTYYRITMFKKYQVGYLDKWCNSIPTLRFIGYDKENLPETLSSYLRYEFFRDNTRYYTERFETGISIDDYWVPHCYNNRRRSIGDIYSICKYYYPKCTPLEVFTILNEMLEEKRISANRCNEIWRFVYFPIRDGQLFRSSDKLEYSNLTYEQFAKIVLK